MVNKAIYLVIEAGRVSSPSLQPSNALRKDRVRHFLALQRDIVVWGSCDVCHRYLSRAVVVQGSVWVEVDFVAAERLLVKLLSVELLLERDVVTIQSVLLPLLSLHKLCKPSCRCVLIEGAIRPLSQRIVVRSRHPLEW